MKSPYYFVPQVAPDDPMRKAGLPVIVCPEWGEQVSHDVPFSDGISGHLDLQLTCETPLFIRDALNKEQHYKTPDGDFGIPGTSLRGMFRSVFEIISFSRMQFVTPSRLSVRDLNNRELYTNHMTSSDSGRCYTPKSKSGWLVESEELDDKGNKKWFIHPCTHWRVEISHYHGPETRDNLEHFVGCTFSKCEVSVSKRFRELGPGGEKQIWFKGDDEAKFHDHSESQLNYRVVQELSEIQKENFCKGWIVLTGRPMKKKHMDFVFGEPLSSGNAKGLKKGQMNDFRFIHAKDNERHKDTPKPNDSLNYWEDRVRGNIEADSLPGIPVFYLEDEVGEVSSFGLAQMFKLAYLNTPDELNQKYLEKSGHDPEKPDFAELLFGHTRETDDKKKIGHTRETDDKKKIPLRGRVTIETAISKNAKPDNPFDAILGSPKPSFYPSYIRQEVNSGGKIRRAEGQKKTKPVYQTYMDENAQLSGWKRYQLRGHFKNISPPKRNQGNVKTRLFPLESGAVFETRVFIHNLRPIELGGLLWCFDFGRATDCFHQLGMGKPFGMGQTKVEVHHPTFRSAEDGYAKILPREKVEEARKAFIDYMNDKFCGEWGSSAQILDLLALARPEGGDQNRCLDYMSIEMRSVQGGKKKNEFVQVKKDGEALVGPRSVAESKRTNDKRYKEMASCVEKKKEEHERLLLAEKNQREAERKSEEVERKARDIAKETQRLLSLTPEERQRERISVMSESVLWDYTGRIFGKEDEETLLAGLELDPVAECEALRDLLGDHEYVLGWQRGASDSLRASSTKQKERYDSIMGIEMVDYQTIIQSIGRDTGKLQEVVGVVNENWSEDAIKQLLGTIKKTLRGNKHWKKPKKALWKERIAELEKM